MKPTFPAKRAGQETPRMAQIVPTPTYPNTQTKLNIVLARRHPQNGRIGEKNCNGGHDSGGYNHSVQNGRLYSLTVKKTLEQVSILHLLDVFYNCSQRVRGLAVLANIPYPTKKIDSFGGSL